MRYFVSAVLVICLFAAPAVHTCRGQAGQEDKYLGRSLTQWLKILKEHKNPKARRLAIVALEVFGPQSKGVVSALVDAMSKDPAEQIREAAALALGEMGKEAKQAVPELIARLEDKSPRVRQAAARALGGDMVAFSKRAIPALADLLKDDDADVQREAAKTLLQFRGDAREVMPKLVAVAKDGERDPLARVFIVNTLALFEEDGPDVVPVLVDIAKDQKNPVAVRTAAVDALPKFGKRSQPASGVLAGIFGDQKNAADLRRAAGVALLKIGGDAKHVWPVAKRVLRDEDKAIRSLAVRIAAVVCRSEPEVVDALIERTKDSNQEVRLAAIQELGALGKNAIKAVPTLEQIVATAPRRSIREAAREALKKIRGS